MQSVMIEIAFKYTYIALDEMVLSGKYLQCITMYIYMYVPNENIAHVSTLEGDIYIYIYVLLAAWGGIAHLALWTINNYVISSNKVHHAHTRKVPFVLLDSVVCIHSVEAKGAVTQHNMPQLWCHYMCDFWL